MVVQPITHIHTDDRGVAWVGDTNTKVIEVAMDHKAYGWDASEMHAAHPHLSLSQIHAALSYYFDHMQELDEAMRQQMERYERLRADSGGQLRRAELLQRLAPK